MSASSPQPAAPQAILRQAGQLGRRHGRAAVHWQIGGSGTAAARESYRELLRGIASGDPAITGRVSGGLVATVPIRFSFRGTRVLR